MYLNIYECSQAYGGPEEGGWWYNCRELIESSSVENLVKAQNTVKILNERFGNNRGEYKMGHNEFDGADDNGVADDSFLMRGGLWGHSEMVARIEKKPGRNHPSVAPHYE
tara:strand:- start:5343 stop:5672 length:330 start_codon:yes stop_codon:yes gene_type:complete